MPNTYTEAEVANLLYWATELLLDSQAIKATEKEQNTKSATEIIIEAMEHADEMSEVVVIYRVKDHNSADEDGFGWLSNTEDTFTRVGMCESAKWGMLHKAYAEES